MKRKGIRWLVLSFGVVAACLPAGLGGFADRAMALPKRPNVVLIQVDDMSKTLLKSQIRDHGKLRYAMPYTLNQLAGRGTEFTRYFSSDPICGPSRATLLSGRSAHNTGVRINAAPFGYTAWKNSDLYQENLPVWLQRAGYRTAHVGKFINGYGATDAVPPGWSDWISGLNNSGAAYYGGPLNLDGTITPPIGSWALEDSPDCKVIPVWLPGACTHATDVDTAIAVKEIKTGKTDKRPFFLSVDYNAPHDDGRGLPGPEPPARFKHLIGKVVPGYNLDDGIGNSTKPSFIQELSPLEEPSRYEISHRYAREVASMRGVDDGVKRILDSLRKTGQLDNTYVVFTSDNGFFHGEHYIAYGKYLPHQPATNLPLIIRGPGIAGSTRTEALGSNLDLASTVLDMTGTADSHWKDGKSLLPFAENPKKASTAPVLLEGFNGGGIDDPEALLDGSSTNGLNQAKILNYTGFVAGRWKYIKYGYGPEELYDLKSDPKEDWNLAGNGDFASGSGKFTPVLAWARGVSTGLKNCVAAACRPKVEVPPRP